MPCNRFSSLPAASSPLTGNEVIPLTQLGVDRKSTPIAIATIAARWRADAPYILGSLVQGTDSGDANIYRSTSATNTNHNPGTYDPSYWLPVLFTADTTLSVPSQIPTIAQAITYLAGAHIPENVTVTIQVANGTYPLTNSQLVLNHPCGDRIHLIGNTAIPGNCTITFSALPSPPVGSIKEDSGSIVVNQGYAFGLIDGFTISKVAGAAAFGHCAILAYGNAALTVGTNMVISGFWAQLAAGQGALLSAIGTSGDSVSLATTTATSQGLFADGGTILANYAAVSTVASTNVAAAIRSGDIILDNAALTVNVASTALVINEGSIWALNASFTQAAVIVDADNSGGYFDTGASYGTIGIFAIITGQLVYNRHVAMGNNTPYPLATLTGADLQVAGLIRTYALELLGTMTGLNFGTVQLDTFGEGIVVTPVAVNAVIVAMPYTTPFTGPFRYTIDPSGTFFTIISEAASADSSVELGWIQIQ